MPQAYCQFQLTKDCEKSWPVQAYDESQEPYICPPCQQFRENERKNYSKKGSVKNDI